MDDLMAAFAGLGTSTNEELVAKFAQIMHTDTATATFFLEASQWKVETAVNAYLSSGAAQAAQQAAMATPYGACQVLDPHGVLNGPLLPNQPFQLTWVLKNNGHQPWPSNAQLVHTEGPRLEGPAAAQLGAIPSNQMVNQTLNLKAPATPGQYASTWRLKYSGGYFGDPIWIITSVAANVSGGSGAATMMAAQQQQSSASAAMAAAGGGGAMAMAMAGGPAGAGGAQNSFMAAAAGGAGAGSQASIMGALGQLNLGAAGSFQMQQQFGAVPQQQQSAADDHMMADDDDL